MIRIVSRTLGWLANQAYRVEDALGGDAFDEIEEQLSDLRSRINDVERTVVDVATAESIMSRVVNGDSQPAPAGNVVPFARPGGGR